MQAPQPADGWTRKKLAVAHSAARALVDEPYPAAREKIEASSIAFLVLVSAAADIVGVPRLQFCRIAKAVYGSSVAHGAPVFLDVGSTMQATLYRRPPPSNLWPQAFALATEVLIFVWSIQIPRLGENESRRVHRTAGHTKKASAQGSKTRQIASGWTSAAQKMAEGGGE
ncbi:hypothetical protein C8R44DRAFT_751039 [Mycena epipterygia]|nr:hypothetical protein C8R44DRAFT_751039 [Mycena epipterygia]